MRVPNHLSDLPPYGAYLFFTENEVLECNDCSPNKPPKCMPCHIFIKGIDQSCMTTDLLERGYLLEEIFGDIVLEKENSKNVG